MTRAELLAFVRRSRLAVQATRHADGERGVQAAVVGFGVTDLLEIVFDTAIDSRKHANLVADPRIALVIGWDHEATLQVEGVADQPTGGELARIQAAYFVAFPEGRARAALPSIAYWRVRATWLRFSDYYVQPPRILELDPATL